MDALLVHGKIKMKKIICLVFITCLFIFNSCIIIGSMDFPPSNMKDISIKNFNFEENCFFKFNNNIDLMENKKIKKDRYNLIIKCIEDKKDCDEIKLLKEENHNEFFIEGNGKPIFLYNLIFPTTTNKDYQILGFSMEEKIYFIQIYYYERVNIYRLRNDRKLEKIDIDILDVTIKNDNEIVIEFKEH